MIDLFTILPILYQTIIVNSSSPCFQNYSAGVDMWKNCGMDKDYITTSLMAWNWITGGYFSMLLAIIFVLITWIKYQKVVYPIITGCFFLPLTYFIFPTVFLTWAFIMAGLAIGALFYYAWISQTNET